MHSSKNWGKHRIIVEFTLIGTSNQGSHKVIFFHAALQFLRCLCGICHRERGKGGEAVGVFFHHVGKNIVRLAADLHCFFRRYRIRYWIGVTEYLYVDLLLSHKIKADGIDIGQFFAGKAHMIVRPAHFVGKRSHIGRISIFCRRIDDTLIGVMFFNCYNPHVRFPPDMNELL